MKSKIEKYFEELSKKLEDEEYFAKFVEEFCYKEMSIGEAMVLLEDVFLHMLTTDKDVFEMPDCEGSHSRNNFALQYPTEDYIQAFDMIEEIVTHRRREYKLFELVEWEYNILFSCRYVFKCTRLCGQGETIRRIELVVDNLFILQ